MAAWMARLTTCPTLSCPQHIHALEILTQAQHHREMADTSALSEGGQRARHSIVLCAQNLEHIDVEDKVEDSVQEEAVKGVPRLEDKVGECDLGHFNDYVGHC